MIKPAMRRSRAFLGKKRSSHVLTNGNRRRAAALTTANPMVVVFIILLSANVSHEAEPPAIFHVVPILEPDAGGDSLDALVGMFMKSTPANWTL